MEHPHGFLQYTQLEDVTLGGQIIYDSGYGVSKIIASLSVVANHVFFRCLTDAAKSTLLEMVCQ